MSTSVRLTAKHADQAVFCADWFLVVKSCSGVFFGADRWISFDKSCSCMLVGWEADFGSHMMVGRFQCVDVEIQLEKS